MSQRAFIRLAMFAIAAAPAAAQIACGGDTPAAPKTAANAAGSGATSSTTSAPAAPRPVTDANVPHASTNSGVNISAEIRQKCGISDEEAYFAFDSSALQPSDTGPLDKVAICFTTGPLAGQTVLLVGRADIVGEPGYNKELGGKRADAVKSYMNGKMDPTHVVSSSQGSDGAVAKEGDVIGMAKDRRVDVMVKH